MGTLHIHYVQSPPQEYNPKNGDCFSGLTIDINELEYLFDDILDCMPKNIKRFEGEDGSDYYERFERTFLENIPDFPLLGRLFEIYRDTYYEYKELPLLKQECDQVFEKYDFEKSSTLIQTLLAAINEVSTESKAIYLASD
jgi:hypothetical protein